MYSNCKQFHLKWIRKEKVNISLIYVTPSGLSHHIEHHLLQIELHQKEKERAKSKAYKDHITLNLGGEKQSFM